MNRSPKTLPTVSQKQKLINHYFSNAYAVYDGQKSYQLVGKISITVAQKTGYQQRRPIIVKQEEFTHFSKHFVKKGTSKIHLHRLFQFIETLNYPDSIY